MELFLQHRADSVISSLKKKSGRGGAPPQINEKSMNDMNAANVALDTQRWKHLTSMYLSSIRSIFLKYPQLQDDLRVGSNSGFEWLMNGTQNQ